MPEIDLPDTPIWIAAASRVIRSLPAGRYRAMNWIAGRGSRPFWARMPADLGALQFRCDLRDVLMREVCITGRYEPQETILLQDLLAAGMTFVDVGANWGYFTLAAAHLVGSRGTVVSVEADPRAAQTLRHNIEKNRLSSVHVFAAAASDVEQNLALFSYGAANDASANFGVALDDAAGDGRVRFEIPARPLDSILDEAGVGRIDLLKMDIEGAEACALVGLRRRLCSEAIDRIVLELHPAYLRKQGRTAESVVSELEAYGFEPWLIDHSPATHALAASSGLTARSLLTPLLDRARLDTEGSWPHVLFVRRGLSPTRDNQGSIA